MKELFQDAQIANTLHIVSDGDQALDFVYQRGEYTDAPPPNIILLDWHLPGTSGKEVLTELENDEGVCHIPVVVLTGSQAEKEVIKSDNPQANAYIMKPIGPDEFIDTVRSFEEFGLSIVRLPLDERGE